MLTAEMSRSAVGRDVTDRLMRARNVTCHSPLTTSPFDHNGATEIERPVNVGESREE